MQVCTTVCGQTLLTTSGSPLSPSHTTKKTSLTPRLRRSVSTLIQNFAPLTAGAGPQPEDVALPGQAHPDRSVERPVADLSVADLDHDGVNEDRRPAGNSADAGFEFLDRRRDPLVDHLMYRPIRGACLGLIDRRVQAGPDEASLRAARSEDTGAAAGGIERRLDGDTRARMVDGLMVHAECAACRAIDFGRVAHLSARDVVTRTA